MNSGPLSLNYNQSLSVHSKKFSNKSNQWNLKCQITESVNQHLIKINVPKNRRLITTKTSCLPGIMKHQGEQTLSTITKHCCTRMKETILLDQYFVSEKHFVHGKRCWQCFNKIIFICSIFQASHHIIYGTAQL